MEQKLYPCYFNIIMALGLQGEFSQNNKLPWDRISEDMKYFKELTTNNIVIMGRKTYESIGKELPNRINIVLTSQIINNENITQCKNFEIALIEAGKLVFEKKAKNIFVIGGKNLIVNCLKDHRLEYIYITRIFSKYEPLIADQYIDFHEESFKLVNTAKKVHTEKYNLSFYKYISKQQDNHPEQTYISLLNNVLNRGVLKTSRTGINTLFIPGCTLEIDMFKYGFPLYTTKRVFFKGIVHELLFFISGKTQTKILENAGINIWKGNTSRQFLDNSEYEYVRLLDEGDMGKGYGFQWRHFGANCRPNQQLEIGEDGIDQLQNLINNIIKVIKTPDSSIARRLIMMAWNPMDIDKQALPPCHLMVQYIVEQKEKKDSDDDKDNDQILYKLHCIVTMRSNDLGCGNPFNVSQYSLLTYIICHLIKNTTGNYIIPGKLTLNMGDAHIYVNHIEAIKELISRPPRQWPTLKLEGIQKTIDEYKIKDFSLLNYFSHPEIKMEMAI